MSQVSPHTSATPLRQMALPNRQNVSISRELDPLTPIHLAGGGGWRDEKTLDVRAFLALRQFPPLARCPSLRRSPASSQLPGPARPRRDRRTARHTPPLSDSTWFFLRN